MLLSIAPIAFGLSHFRMTAFGVGASSWILYTTKELEALIIDRSAAVDSHLHSGFHNLCTGEFGSFHPDIILFSYKTTDTDTTTTYVNESFLFLHFMQLKGVERVEVKVCKSNMSNGNVGLVLWVLY